MPGRELWRPALMIAGGGPIVALAACALTDHAPRLPGEEPQHLNFVTALVWSWGLILLIWLGAHQFAPASRLTPVETTRDLVPLHDRTAMALEALIRGAVKGSPANRDELAAALRDLARERSANTGKPLSPALERLCRRVESGAPAHAMPRHVVDTHIKEIGTL